MIRIIAGKLVNIAYGHGFYTVQTPQADII
nr:MAG TPA: hypothetical protein [Caudoviricetes sp.]